MEKQKTTIRILPNPPVCFMREPQDSFSTMLEKMLEDNDPRVKKMALAITVAGEEALAFAFSKDDIEWITDWSRPLGPGQCIVGVSTPWDPWFKRRVYPRTHPNYKPGHQHRNI